MLSGFKLIRNISVVLRTQQSFSLIHKLFESRSQSKGFWKLVWNMNGCQQQFCTCMRWITVTTRTAEWCYCCSRFSSSELLKSNIYVLHHLSVQQRRSSHILQILSVQTNIAALAFWDVNVSMLETKVSRMQVSLNTNVTVPVCDRAWKLCPIQCFLLFYLNNSCNHIVFLWMRKFLIINIEKSLTFSEIVQVHQSL